MAHLLAPSAQIDLQNIWDYIAESSASSEVPDRFMDALAEHFLLIASRPYLGRDRSHDLGNQRRSFAVGEYIIIYRVQGSDVLILRIVHGRRDLEAIFGH